MATDVSICNEALAHLGDNATISSINPPEGSVQAEHCQRFYPTCLADLLEMHTWSFASKRVMLTQLAGNPSSSWAYAYALPADCVNTTAVIASDAPDDYSAPGRVSSQTENTPYYSGTRVGGSYTPQDYATEMDPVSGGGVILTNQVSAVLRYTFAQTDVSKFSPLFSRTLGWLLAAQLAGPVLKGDAGRKAAIGCTETAMKWLTLAKDSDASSRQSKPQHQVSWINARS